MVPLCLISAIWCIQSVQVKLYAFQTQTLYIQIVDGMVHALVTLSQAESPHCPLNIKLRGLYSLFGHNVTQGTNSCTYRNLRRPCSPYLYHSTDAIYTCFIHGCAYETSQSNFFADKMLMRPSFVSWEIKFYLGYLLSSLKNTALFYWKGDI